MAKHTLKFLRCSPVTFLPCQRGSRIYIYDKLEKIIESTKAWNAQRKVWIYRTVIPIEHSSECELNANSVRKLNILSVATFLFKVNQKTAPNVFLSRFQKPPQQTIHNTKTSKYSISIKGSYIWNLRETNHHYA